MSEDELDELEMKLSPSQQRMMDWIENHTLVIGDRNMVFTNTGIYVGTRNTLMSLVNKGLVKRFNPSSVIKMYKKSR